MAVRTTNHEVFSFGPTAFALAGRWRPRSSRTSAPAGGSSSLSPWTSPGPTTCSARRGEARGGGPGRAGGGGAVAGLANLQGDEPRMIPPGEGRPRPRCPCQIGGVVRRTGSRWSPRSSRPLEPWPQLSEHPAAKRATADLMGRTCSPNAPGHTGPAKGAGGSTRARTGRRLA